MKNENKGILTAVLLSLVVIFGMELLFPTQKQAPAPATSVQPISVETVDTAAVPEVVLPAEEEEGPIVSIQSDTLSGSIRLKGARFDNLVFSKYKKTTAADSPDVSFLTSRFFADFSVAVSNKGIDIPTAETIWTANQTVLTPEQPITLKWQNEQGFVFERTIALDEEYMFTITDRVTNPTEQAVSFAFGGVITRIDPPEKGTATVHEGFVGVMNETLEEEKYAVLKDDREKSFKTTGGWIGQTDKYWLAAMAFNQQTAGVKADYLYRDIQGKNVFQTRFVMPPLLLNKGGVQENKTFFFAGPKELKIITDYMDRLGIEKFDLAIDFGWYYFLTKPFLYILGWLNQLVGNMGIAILIFATLLRILLLPIAGKSFESMAKMRKLQPKIQEIQERFKHDKLRQNQETMALYKKAQVNPAAGCLPLFIQIPVFFSLYKVLSVSIEMRQAPFFGWIHDLSAPDPSSVFTLFGYLPWPIPGIFNIGVWPVLMGLTMYLQQKMSSPSTVNAQENPALSAMKWMPLIFMFMMGHFASGLVIYWTWSNILSIAQQRYVMHKYGVDK